MLVGFAFLLLGCPDSGEGDLKSKAAPARASQPTDLRRARAVEAAKALGTGLKARLIQALQDGGPKAGIAACNVAAPEIASTVAETTGLKLGRTSFRLRNPANAPPAWAEADVEARVEAPSFSEAPDGTLRALLPIRMEALCVTCHGARESFSEGLTLALAEHYPGDRATGFKDGELRGWFWVEVPPE